MEKEKRFYFLLRVYSLSRRGIDGINMITSEHILEANTNDAIGTLEGYARKYYIQLTEFKFTEGVASANGFCNDPKRFGYEHAVYVITRKTITTV